MTAPLGGGQPFHLGRFAGPPPLTVGARGSRRADGDRRAARGLATPWRHPGFDGGRRGANLCLGAQLARMEMRVMLEEASRRLPHLKLVEQQEYTYSPNTSFRGPEHVLVTWDPANNPQPADRPHIS
jgi:cytochrome P450